MDKIQSLRNTIGGNYSKPKVSDMAMFRNQLSEYSVAMDYLRINRNLSDETIKSFMIGYDYYRNNIAIPESKNGELVNIGYRSLEQDPKIKYQKERGCENWIFNERALEIAKKKQGILIVSNQFDCMSAWQAGFENVVSVPVGKGSYGEWIELFDTIPKVYIAFENTKQSKKFALDLAERIGTDKSYEVIFPEDIVDCNHFFKQHDSNEFKDLIREARPFYKYKFQGLRDVIDSIKEKTDNVLKIKCIPYVEFEQDWLTILSGTSNIGKCHGKGTKILMYDGSIKNVEDIIVGDKLMGDDSTPRNVLSLARGKEEMYRIWERGEYYDVNESHILSLQHTRLNKKTKHTQNYKYEKTVKDYISMKESYRKTFRGWKTSVVWEEKELKLDPYILGLWLGDGTSSEPSITTMDNSIVESIYNFANKIGCKIRKQEQPNNKSSVYSIVTDKGLNNPFRQLLTKYNLLNNKHIPEDYKINSKENRLQLLAGLIDTDGYLGKTEYGESYEIIQKNKQLANDIVFIARSLGFRVSIKKSIKSIKSIGFTGEYNRINIVGNLGLIPVRMEYKKSNFIPKKHWLTSKLEIKSLGIGDYYGFTLDGNGLYLLGNFTVTHNTSIGLNIASELSQRGIPNLVLPFERGIRTVGKRFLQVHLNKSQGELDSFADSDWDNVVGDLVDLPLYFSVPSRDEIKETVAKAKKLFNIKVIIVDHLDYLVRKSNDNHNVETSNTLQEFKSLAQEHNIIFIIIHHIKKQEGVGGAVKKPKMEDLKGSSSIYQDPEAVIMLSSPEKGQLEVDIVKNKGPMGSRIFEFNQMTGVVGKDITDIPSLMSDERKVQEGFKNF